MRKRTETWHPLSKAVADMKVGNLIEVGVAVRDLSVAAQTITALLGLPTTVAIRAPMFEMEFCMSRLGTVDFELMAPCESSSVISRFLARRGEGLHHIAFQVPDLDETIASCRAKGLSFTSNEPILLEGLRAAFLAPSCLSGLLVEFIENPHNWFPAAERPRKDIGRISGFAVAVDDIDAAAFDYSRVLGAAISDRSWNERLATHVRFASVNDVRFELIPSSAFENCEIQPARDRQVLRHVCLEVFERNDFTSLRAVSESQSGDDREITFLTDPAVCHGVTFEVHAA
jgi:methylmalonyl-CoA/ethylmalonyl-CoA epimerase